MFRAAVHLLRPSRGTVDKQIGLGCPLASRIGAAAVHDDDFVRPMLSQERESLGNIALLIESGNDYRNAHERTPGESRLRVFLCDLCAFAR
jgi:hypothetical protein